MADGYERQRLAALLPYPQKDANKYSRGRLVVIAGSTRYPGAAVLAARAGQRAGAGYTEVITDGDAVAIIQAAQPSLVVRSREETEPLEPLFFARDKPCAYVIGPGFDPDDSSFYPTLLPLMESTDAPLLLDGGGLSMLLEDAGRSVCRKRFIADAATVITPHFGEASRLARVFDLPREDAAKLSRDLSLAYGAVTVLKGPTTYVSDGEEVIVLGDTTPALAKAGTGDVLAGVIGALLAQGLSVLDAAVLGVSVHSKAGCLASEEFTSVAVVAEDVIDCIALAIKAIGPQPVGSDTEQEGDVRGISRIAF